MMPRVRVLFLVVCCHLLEGAEPAVIHEVRGANVLSRTAVMDTSGFTRSNALRIVHQFVRQTGHEWLLARLAVFTSEAAAQQFEVGKGDFHPTIEMWETQQRHQRAGPALEVILMGNTILTRFRRIGGAAEVLRSTEKGFRNWHQASNEPAIAYASMWPGMYTADQGTAPDDIRIRLYFKAEPLPPVVVAQNLTERYARMLQRPVTLKIQRSATFVEDPYYPYLNPFVPTQTVSASEAASENVVTCQTRSGAAECEVRPATGMFMHAPGP